MGQAAGMSAADTGQPAGTAAAGSVQQAAAAAPGLYTIQGGAAQTEYTRRMRENYNFFAPAAFLYACLYAFCTFKNGSGVTFPFFIAGSLLFFSLSISKLEISLKKGSGFYMVSAMLLAVSTFCTDDGRIILLNKTGIFLLILSLLLEQMYDTSKWNLGKFLSSITVLIFAGIGEVGRPFSDGAVYRKTKGKESRARVFDIALGLIIAIPLVLLIGMLLGSADAVFRQLMDRVIKAVKPANLLNIFMRIIFIFFASYCLLSYLCKKRLKEEVADKRKGEPALAITISFFLTALYMVFSVIQILYLFMGSMQLPEDYTYAEYAREGFFQLLGVSVLNLVIVLFMLGHFRESRVLKGILTVMSLCTFVMIASSTLRMIIYIKYYYLTFLRIFVLWALAVLFLLFAGVIACIVRERFPLFRYSAVVVTVLFLALSFSHPDYWIARVNVANIDRHGTDGFFVGSNYSDFDFLSRLNADAAPVLIPYLEQKGMNFNLTKKVEEADGKDISIGDRAMVWLMDSYTEEGFGYAYLDRLLDRTEGRSWRCFNVSRFMALQAVQSRIQP